MATDTSRGLFPSLPACQSVVEAVGEDPDVTARFKLRGNEMKGSTSGLLVFILFFD